MARSAKTKRQYQQLKEAILSEHPPCERCGAIATQIHHKKGRTGKENGTDLLVYEPYFMRVCYPCHAYIESHPMESYERGWMIRRLTL